MHDVFKQIDQYIKENYEKNDSTLLFSSMLTAPARPKPKKKIAKPAVPLKTKVESSPPPPPTTKKEKAPSLSLEKPKVERPKEVDHFQTIYKRIAPQITVHPNPPPDTVAKRVKLAWKDQKTLPAIPIFVDASLKDHLPFLTNLAHAIDVTFGNAAIYDITEIEKENRWVNILTSKDIKCIIIPDILLRKSAQLMEHYREVPNQSLKKIAQFPTHVLQDINLYYKSPELKRTLWKTIHDLLALRSSHP